MKATKFLSVLTAIVGSVTALYTVYMATSIVSWVFFDEEIDILGYDLANICNTFFIPILLCMAGLTLFGVALSSNIKGTRGWAALTVLSTLLMAGISSLLKIPAYFGEEVLRENDAFIFLIFGTFLLALINLVGYTLTASKLSNGSTRFSAVVLSISSLLYATYCSVFYALYLIDTEMWWNFLINGNNEEFQAIMAVVLAIYSLCMAIFYGSLPSNFKQTEAIGNPQIVNPQGYIQPTPPFEQQ